MAITEEKKNSNYILWTELLKKYDCYSEELIDKYGEDIKNAPFAMTDKNGGCYDGSMIDTVISILCVIATHINEDAFGMNQKGKMKHENLHVDKQSLMKVLLLQHIAKAVMFVPSTEQWKISKGMFYEFNDKTETSLKLGEKSAFICLSCGITLTETEYEAMKIIDKEDDKTMPFITPLSEIVKISNQLTSIELYKRNSAEKQ